MDNTQEIAPVEPKLTRQEKWRMRKLRWRAHYMRTGIYLHEHKTGSVTAFQFVCFIAGLVGISLLPVGAWAVPAAIIIGAIIGITAAERQ